MSYWYPSISLVCSPGAVSDVDGIHEDRTDTVSVFNGPPLRSGSWPTRRRRPAPGRDRMKYRVLIEQDEDGAYVAEVPSLPGCITQGATRDEALSNVREAIRAYLASLEEHGEPVPPPISEEIVEV